MKKTFSMQLSVQRCLAAVLVAVLLLPASPRTMSAALATTARSGSGDTAAPKSSLTSLLIVAQDNVSDPNFGRSIVLVMNNLGPAPVGIIVNRPTPLTVAKFFPQMKALAHVQDKVYFGGPVEFDEVWFLFRANAAPASATTIRVCDDVYVSSDGKLLRKLLGRPRPMEGLRIFIGHAGWAPGQLQAEIQGGAWLPRHADADSILDAKPQVPWPSGRGPKAGT